MQPNEVFVNVAAKIDEEEVGNEHVKEVLGEMIIKTQKMWNSIYGGIER